MKLPDYILLLHQSLRTELDERERTLLADWLAESPDHRQQAEELRRAWQLAGEAIDSRPIDQAHFQHQRERLGTSLTHAHKFEVRKYRKRLHFWVGAAAVLLVGIAILSFAYVINPSEAAWKSTFVNGHQTLVLPDSTHVSLHDNWHFKFAQTWRSRHAYFQGAGLFQVAEDSRKPFTLNLPVGKIHVLGTSFFVQTYSTDSAQVRVVSGTVALTLPDKKIILTKDQQAIVTTHAIRRVMPEEQDINFTAWYTGTLHFENTPLHEILSRLERELHIVFKIYHHEILSCRFTGTFNEESQATILHVLAESLGISFRQQGDVYLVEGTRCKP